MFSLPKKSGAHGWEPIHLAAAHGDETALRNLLADTKRPKKPVQDIVEIMSTPKKKKTASAILEEPTNNGDRALHVALRKGQVSAVRVLVEAGCDVHAKGNNGESVVHICAELDLTRELEWFKTLDVDVSAITEDGKLAAHYAAAGNRVDVLQWLQTSKFTSQFVTRDYFGDTPLHIAARCGASSAVLWLIDLAPRTGLGRALFANNDSNKDPSAVAKESGYLVLGRKIQDRKREYQTAQKQWKNTGNIFLESARNGDLDALKAVYLSNDQSIIDFKNLKTAHNALQEAVSHGHLPVVQWLLAQRGQRSLVNSKTGKNVIHVAAEHGHLHVLKYLVLEYQGAEQQRVDLSRTCPPGQTTALTLAMQHGHSHVEKWLKEFLSRNERTSVRHNKKTTTSPRQAPVVVTNTKSSKAWRSSSKKSGNAWANAASTRGPGAQLASPPRHHKHPQSSKNKHPKSPDGARRSSVGGGGGGVWGNVPSHGSSPTIEQTHLNSSSQQQQPTSDDHRNGDVQNNNKATAKHRRENAGAHAAHKQPAKPPTASHRATTNDPASRSVSSDTVQSSRSKDDNEEMMRFLEELGLEEWYDKLYDDGFDSLKHIQTILESDLLELGMVKKGHRRALLHAIDEMRNERPVNVRQFTHSSNEGGFESGNSGHKSTSSQPSSMATMNIMSIDDPTSLDLGTASQQSPTNFKITFGGGDEFLVVKNGVLQCNCKRWKQQLGPFQSRVCSHIIQYRKITKLQQPSGDDVNASGHLINSPFLMNRKSSVKGGGIANPGDGRSAQLDQSPAVRRLDSIRSESSSQSLTESLAAHHILNFNEITLGNVIGEGSFGVVRQGMWRGMNVAVKELRLSQIQQQKPGAVPRVKTGDTISFANIDPAAAACSLGGLTIRGVPDQDTGRATSEDRKNEQWDLKHEAVVLSRVCNHENIVPFLGVILEPAPSVVTRLMPGGSVEQLLVVNGPRNRRNQMSMEAIVQMMVDAAAGVLHLHREGVIHRDLATRNLLVDEHGRVRISDFGFARVKEQNASKGYTSQHIGPIKWMSPEALRFRQFSEYSDVFGFGVTLYEAVVGKRPWEGVETMDVVFRVCNGERMPEPYGPDPTVARLIKACQLQNPRSRPTMLQVHEALMQVLGRERLNCLREEVAKSTLNTDEKPSSERGSSSLRYVEFDDET